MPVEKLVLHKKDNSACPTEMQSFRKENPNILRQPSPATSFYLPTYCPTHAIHEWVSVHVGTKPIWQMTKEFQLEGCISAMIKYR